MSIIVLFAFLQLYLFVGNWILPEKIFCNLHWPCKGPTSASKAQPRSQGFPLEGHLQGKSPGNEVVQSWKFDIFFDWNKLKGSTLLFPL